jgi:hypothetical protein
MKTMNLWAKALLLLASGALFATGCSSSDNDDNGTGGGSGSNKFNLTVTLTAPSGYETSDLPAMTVTAVNADKELTYTEELAAGENSVSFEVSSGQYRITATGQYSNTISFTGAVQADVFADQNATIELAEVNESPLLFKEIYSTSSPAYSITDTYFEIVNNSEKVQYLDGVIVAAITAPYPTSVNPWESVYPLYPSYGVTVAFPGSGTEHPLQPGESVVVANDATDWSDQQGADLSKADWEIYIPNVSVPSADVDYNAPNMTIVANENTQRHLTPGFMKGAFMLIKLPEGTTPEAYASDSENYMVEPNSTKTQRCLMFQSSDLLDAVEIWDVTETEQAQLLMSQDDAGKAYVTGFSGKSIRRKVTKIENGRAYYQDTNNSSNDFLTDQPLTPGQEPTQAD